MKRILFDLETDGLLDVVSVIHCGTVYDLDTDEIRQYGPDEIPALVADIVDADVLAGHYICGFDMHVLERLHGVDPRGYQYLDTKVMSQAIFPGSPTTSTLVGMDMAFQRRHGEDALPKKFTGSHKLMAWSHRLRLGDEGKLEYKGGWEKWSQEMHDYNRNDVIANVHLLRHFLKKAWPLDVFYAESLLTYYLTKQTEYGVGFDEKAAVELMTDLVDRRGKMALALNEVFPPVEVPNGPPRIAKADRVCRKYAEGHPKWFPSRKKGETYQLFKTEEFNPASGQHIARRLIERYGWKPNDYTPGGQPQITDEILRDLPWPEAQMLADYQGIKRVLGYLNEGRQAWLSLSRDGRIHGSVTSCAARTTRAGHSRPNLAQVPRHGSPFGDECRALFRAAPGRDLVGADASSLQLAIYAHFVAKYDGGLLAGICEDPEGDAHEYMRSKSGLFLRDWQKKVTYGKWFGAGHYKLGLLALSDWHQALDEGITDEPAPSLNEAAALGAKIDRRMSKNMAGYSDLAKDCRTAAERGFITLLNGHPVEVTQERTVLVTLLQGNEAVIMKRAYLLAQEALADIVYFGWARPVLWVHDEIQWECDPEVSDFVGKTLVASIVRAGIDVGLRLKLRGNYKVGTTWAQTH